MATLNTRRPPTTHRTHEGAPARHISPEDQLSRSVMACLLWEKSFYDEGVLIADRIRDLVPKVGAAAVAQLAIQARSEMNLRHVPLLLVREMARHPSHRPLVAKTLEAVIQRADELAEFLALYFQDGRQPIAKQVQRGLARAFGKFSEYQLAKYNRTDKSVTLRDVLFLSHAKPRDEAQAALWRRLVEDKLAVPDTWEVELSKGGPDKQASWSRLVTEEKLGALALLRNLRNITEAKVDDALIRKALGATDVSRVLPFRFIAAARHAPRFEPELESALFRNVASLPKLSGRTVVLVDISPSMDANLSGKSDMKRVDAACGLAMILREICGEVRVFSFSNRAVEVPPRRGFALRDAIVRSQPSNGTLLGTAVKAVSGSYDRLVVITDEESQDPVPNPDPDRRGYMLNVSCEKNGVGYGPWVHVDGFSEAVVRYLMEHERGEAR
jgi:60 kDa SS-A/Ro ribonucleoprotein